jgi:FixJ family two-component response regulator
LQSYQAAVASVVVESAYSRSTAKVAYDVSDNGSWTVVDIQIFVRKILVVCDDAFIGSEISSILAYESTDIVLVRDAASGISALALSRFDLLIVDIFLPGMDGLIAKVKGRLTLPIIAMTGVRTFEFMHPKLDFMDLAIKAGATFSPEQLLTAVYSCLGPAHLRDRFSVAEPRQTSTPVALAHSDIELAFRPSGIARPAPMMEEERDGTAQASVARELKESLAILLGYLRAVQRENETNPLIPGTTREMTKCALLETERACRMVNGLEVLDTGRPIPRDNFGTRSEQDRLTPREHEVLAPVVDGASNKQGGFRLSISVRTFESHRASVMSKLGAKNVAQLIHIALRRAA